MALSGISKDDMASEELLHSAPQPRVKLVKSVSLESLEADCLEILEAQPDAVKEEDKEMDEAPESWGSAMQLSAAQLTLVIWILTSTSTLMFNKQLFSTGSFPFPLTLLLLHQTGLTLLLNGLKLAAPSKLLQYIMPGATKSSNCCYWRSFLPLGILQVAALASQNMSLELVSAHSVVMLAASKPILVAVIQASTGMQPFNCLQIKVLFCVAAGVSISAGCEASMTAKCFIYLMAAQVLESLRITLMQKLFSDSTCELDALTVLSKTAPTCMLLLLPLAYAVEIRHVELSVLAKPGFLSLAGSATLAFAVNVMNAQVIKDTSAITLVLLGVIKDFLSIFISAWFFAAELHASQVLGYMVAIAFINVYKKLQTQDSQSSLIGLLLEILAAYRSRSLARALVVLMILAMSIPLFMTSYIHTQWLPMHVLTSLQTFRVLQS